MFEGRFQMKVLVLGLAIIANMPAATAANPKITIISEPVEGPTITERGPQRFVAEGMEIRPQTRSYMLVIPTFRPGEAVPQSYTLEPDPETQMPDLDAPDFQFRPLHPQPIKDMPKK
jgi:hypothetical protein